ATDDKVVGTIELGGQPEGTTTDAAGNVFVNLEDTAEVLRLDARELKVLDRWSVAPAKLPVSLAIDPATGRLFVGCRNKELLVLDAKTGKSVTKLPIGDPGHAAPFAPAPKL